MTGEENLLKLLKLNLLAVSISYWRKKPDRIDEEIDTLKVLSALIGSQVFEKVFCYFNAKF